MYLLMDFEYKKILEYKQMNENYKKTLKIIKKIEKEIIQLFPEEFSIFYRPKWPSHSFFEK